MRIAPAMLFLCLALAAAQVEAKQNPADAAGNGDTSDLSLALAKVSLYAEQDKLNEALQLLDQLKTRYPDNPQVLAAEADLDFRVGNRGAAFAALNRASDLDPNNQDIINRQRTSLMEQGPFAGVGYQYRHTGQANENIVNAGGQAALSPTLSAQLDVQNDHISTNTPITNVYGEARNFSGNRQMESLALGKVFHNGDEANGFLYGNDDTVGGGAQYSAWDRYGATSLQGSLNKPDWDYPILVVENGTRDNIRLERRQIITPHLLVTLGGGYNRYNLQDENNVAGAEAWDLNAAYTHPIAGTGKPGKELILGVSYAVDAEYFTHMRRQLDNTGAIFKPFPISSYEIHTLNLTASKNISSQLYAEGFGGYGIDRLGGNGPLFGASLLYSPIEHLGIELRGSRSLLGGLNTGGLNTNEKEDILGLNLKWHW